MSMYTDLAGKCRLKSVPLPFGSTPIIARFRTIFYTFLVEIYLLDYSFIAPFVLICLVCSKILKIVLLQI